MRIPTKEQLIYWSSIFYDTHIGNQGIHVIGYPKTGTNWVCNLLSSYYNVPVLESWNEKMTVFSRRVFHLHRFYKIENIKDRTIYVLRDGRDAIVSRYFMVLRIQRAANVNVRKRFESYCGQKMTEDNVRELLPKFIDFFFTVEKSSSINYRDHVMTAIRENLYVVKYEDLLADKTAVLTKCIEFLNNGEAVEGDQVKRAIEDNDFKKLKAKKHQNDAIFLRKGKSGDWKNYFTIESNKRFHKYAGEALIIAKYETDTNWINNSNCK